MLVVMRMVVVMVVPMLVFVPMIMVMSMLVRVVVAVEVGHVMVVVLVGVVEDDAEVAAVETGLFHAADFDAAAVEREAGERGIRTPPTRRS